MIDPIVEEIHKVRAALWESCGRDWRALLEYFDRRSAEHPERMVTRAELERERKNESTVVAPAKKD